MCSEGAKLSFHQCLFFLCYCRSEWSIKTITDSEWNRAVAFWCFLMQYKLFGKQYCNFDFISKYASNYFTIKTSAILPTSASYKFLASHFILPHFVYKTALLLCTRSILWYIKFSVVNFPKLCLQRVFPNNSILPDNLYSSKLQKWEFAHLPQSSK